MSTMQHVSFQRWLNQTPAAGRDSPVAAELGAVYTLARRDAERARCCDAIPAVIAIIPRWNGRHAFTDVVEGVARRDLDSELRALGK